MTTTVYRFLCLDHRPPVDVAPLPYDDGRPACEVCGRANYAVKPYPVNEKFDHNRFIDAAKTE